MFDKENLFTNISGFFMQPSPLVRFERLILQYKEQVCEWHITKVFFDETQFFKNLDASVQRSFKE